MAKTVAERLAEGRKNRQAGQSSIQHSSTNSVSERLAKSRLGKTINFDTFDSDLKALGTTVESIYNGWQPQDTMNNTKASIVSMQERLNAYQEYAKLFGGEDVTELANGYKSILDDWDNRAATYGKFKTAEDYTKAAEREKSLPTADLNAVSTEVADLDKQIAAIKAQKDKFDGEYKASGGYIPSGSNYNRPSANQVKTYQEWQAKSSEYEKQIKELESKKADRQAYYDDAKTTQETLATIQKETKMASDPKNMDGFNQYIANYEAMEKENETPWWVTALNSAATANDNPANQAFNTVIANKRDDKSWQLPQGDWSDDEKRVLGGYFQEDPQKAIDYVVKKNNEKAKAEQGETEKAIQDSATSTAVGGIGHFIGSIATAPFGLADYLDDVTDKVAGRPIIEESFVTPFEYSQAVSSGQTTHLNEVSGTLNENIPVIGGKGLGDVVGLGRSVLQSAASAYTLGGVGTLVSYFGQGAAAGVDDALSRGATDEQALTYGLVLGAAEGVSEMMGADKLLKLGSPNEIRKILVNAFKKGGGKEFWKLVDKQGKAEAIEELFSGVAGQVADNFILQGKSNFEALTREYRAMGMSAVEAQKKAWMKSIGDVAYDTLGGYISGALHAGPQVAVSAHKLNAENKTVGKEIRGNERVTDMLDIASLSPQESDALAAYTEYAKQGVNAENITDAQLGNLYGMVEGDAASTVFSKKATKEQKADAETTYNRLAKMKTENKAAKTANELAQTDEEGVVTPVTREMLVNEKAKGMSNESEAKAELFRLVDDGHSNVEDYADSFNLVVDLARNEFDQDYILEHRGVLSTGQVNSIYQSVVTNPKMAQQKRLDALIQEQGDNLEIKGTIDDSVIDYGNTGAEGKVNWNSLHPNVKATIAYVSGFSTKVAGMDVQLVTNGRDYGFTGQYDRQGNTMLVDITALTERVKSADTKGRKDNARFIVSTVAHEVTHWMEEKAPELYAQYDKMVMDALTANGRTEAEVLGRRRALLEKAEAKRAKNENRKPREITDKEVRREVIARASEDMLAMSEEGKKFFESLSESEQKQFVGKIKEIIRNIKEWIKNVLSTLKSDAPEAVELRLLAKDLDAISKKWDEMLRQAAKANAAMKKAGVNDKAIMESKASDTQNADIDNFNPRRDNISRANNEGDFINEFHSALSGAEWRSFYNGLVKDGHLQNTRVGTIATVVVGNKIVFAERQYMKEEVHDYVVSDVFRINNTVSNFDLHLIKEAIEEGVITYDTRTIYKELHKLLKAAFSTGILYRFDGDSLQFVDGVTAGENRADHGAIRGNSKEGASGEGLSLGNQSGIQRDNGVLSNDVSNSDIDDFNINDFTIDDLLNMSDEDFQKAYDSLGLDDLFASDESAELNGGEYISIEDISEELNAEPEKIEILIRREGLGASHVEENRTAVMTQARIDRGIKESGARFSPDYARRYITSISTKDFIDLTVLQKNMDRKAFDANVEGDSGSKMGDFDYESALRNEEQSPYLSIDRSTGRIIGHNGRHRIRALEMAGIEAVEIEIEFYDEDGSLMKYNSETIPDLAISSQFDTAIETHISNIIPLNETHRAEVESTYGEKAHGNAGVQYSDIDEDSDGNKLTAEQKEYFKNSTVRDEQGKLKVMYHGTPNAGFTKFKSGTYFTEHKWYAERYKERSASSLSYKPTANNPDVYAVYLNIQKPFDTRNPEEQEIFNNEYLGHYGMGTPLMESGLPDWLDGMDLQEFLEEQGYDYDGLILDEGSVGGYGDEVISRGISYVVFNPEQVKNIDNQTPTADPDIRYSDIDEDSEGVKLSKAQQEYFKDSKARDENGKLKVVYHGSRNDFTAFDMSMLKDDLGIFFAETSNGKQYGDEKEYYLAINNPLIVHQGKEYADALVTGETQEQIRNRLIKEGYDGVKIMYNRMGGGYIVDWVAFYPEQAKLTSNKKPSANPDVRYSDIDELDDLNAQLKEKQNQIYSASMEVRKFDAKAAEDKLYATLQKEGATKQELDDALQEYAKWGEESGYADASAKLSALKDEEKLLRREIQKVEDRLHDELKEQIAHWSDEDVKKYVSKAVRKYHTTTRLDKASYLVTTGSMLDFSDGQGYRVKDHREISEILDLPDYAEYSDGMIAFMNMGNIRLQTYGIDVAAMPNAKQFSALRDIIFTVMRENDEFSVDFSKTDGYSAGSVTYGKGTSASKIIADIKSYFETGVVPEEQSSIRDFLYSDIDAEVDIYEVLGENKRLQNENKKLHEDFDRLMERLKLERQLTHGNHFNENQLDAVAGHIRNLGDSNYSKPELVKKLREVYTYLATSKDVTWDDLFARLYGIAEDVLSAARPVYSPNDYYANIYKDIRNTEISLSDEQKQYVKSMLGVDAHKAFFGKIKVSDNGIPLNSKWEEWAGKYPNEFAETNDKDQVLALLDIYETAKELKEVVEEYDVVERTRWLANEIYNQYWNVSTIRTTADKYDQQIKRLNYEHRNTMKELRDSYNERLEKQKKADRAERSRIFKKLREDHIKELKEIRQSGKERLDKYKEEAKRKTLIQSVTANSLTLNEWMVKNSKDKHIHESMKGPVVNLLQAIDFSSKRALGMWGGDMSGVPTKKDISLQKALSQVKEMMADASVGKEDLVLLYGHELDADIKDMVESVDNLMRNVGDNEFILNKMTLNDLITLDNVVKTIKHAVTQMNKFHTVHHAKGIANLAQEEIIYAEKLGEEKVYDEQGMKSAFKKLVKWTNVTPYYAFKRFGAAGQKIFEAVQDGWDKLAFNVKQIIDFTQKAYKSEEVRTWEKELHEFDILVPATDREKESADYKPKYQKVQMTTAQVMNLYLLNKREAAKRHLLGGGIKVKDITIKKGKPKIKGKKVNFTQDQIDKIVGSLTPRQIEVADALSKFMNTTASDWGNEVSMARFGVKMFGEKDYVPMQVDKSNINSADPNDQNNSLFKLLNMSFTKGLTEGANNRLVVGSIFDVFAQHTSDMAKYNALALPVLDAFRWYNYTEKAPVGEEGHNQKSVKDAIETAFGKDGLNYITTFLEDLNGAKQSNRDQLAVKFFKTSKLASVGFNLRVVLLQPTSYFRASAVINHKYLASALFHTPKTQKRGMERAEKYCGMALWKSLGYFDTNIQKGMTEQIKHDDGTYDKWVERSMKLAGAMDKVTLGVLWNAAEQELKSTRKDLTFGSEEFFVEVGKRLRDIIYATQVVDSTVTRSEMMRSPDTGNKILTTFASEPTLAYNMLADAYFQTQLDARELGNKKAAIKKNSKHMARVFTAYTVTNLVAALVESGFDAFRDDDDEEMDLAEFMKAYLSNFAADMSVVGKLPYLKDGLSILQGYSPSRSDLQWMQSAYYTGKGIVKHLEGEGNPVTTIKNGLKTISYLSGLGFYNAYRDFMATLHALDILTAEELEEILGEFVE